MPEVLNYFEHTVTKAIAESLESLIRSWAAREILSLDGGGATRCMTSYSLCPGLSLFKSPQINTA
jgi:hypothetical protein